MTSGIQKLENILNKRTINSNDYNVSYLDILNTDHATEIKDDNNIIFPFMSDANFSLGKLAKSLSSNNKNLIETKQDYHNEIVVDNEVLIKEIYDPDKHINERSKYLKLNNSFKLGNLAKL
jgi:hypothetical protein